MQRASAVLGLTSAFLLAPLAVLGQLPQRLEFEVASVRVSGPQAAGERMPANGDIGGGPGTSDPTRMTFFRVPLGNILMTAFEVPANRLKAPEWASNVLIPVSSRVSRINLTALRYDIVATMPPGTTKAQAHEMLRNLLIDRFKLTYHLQKKDFDGYAATAAKGGVKLQPSETAKESPGEAAPLAAKFPLGPDGFADLPAGQPAIVATIVDGSRKVRWAVRMMPVASMLEMLKMFYPYAARIGDAESSLGSILDETGLAGRYDFKFEYPLDPFEFGRALEYSSGAFNFADRTVDVSWKSSVRFQTATDIKPDFEAIASEALADQPDSDSALLAAIEKQLGIKLVKSKIPLDVVIVDHVEKTPVEN